MRRRVPSLPFVVTFATAATAAGACGGIAIVENDTTGGGGSATGTGTGTGTSASTSSTATSGPASSSSTGNPIDCPPTSPSGYVPCEVSPGVCSYDVACQSGQVNLSFTCASGYWEIVPSPCAFPYDSCPGTEYYCDSSWWMPTATNPPSPCPEEPPPAGEPCTTGGMGGVWEHCGYRCKLGDPSAQWTIATCTSDVGSGFWVYEGVCDDG